MQFRAVGVLERIDHDALDVRLHCGYSYLMNTTRYIAKCRTCKCHTSSLCSGQDMHRAKDDPRREGPGGVYHHARTGGIVLDCKSCGKPMWAHPVQGKISEKHVCGARCMASTGPSCECSCGGKNHGASHAT